MPFSYTISQAERIAYVTANGPVNLRSSVEVISKLAVDPQFKSDYGVIVDLREMEYLPTSDELRGLASVLSVHNESYQDKVAIIVSEAALFLAHMAVLFSDIAGFKMRAFTDMTLAQRWIIKRG